MGMHGWHGCQESLAALITLGEEGIEGTIPRQRGWASAEMLMHPLPHHGLPRAAKSTDLIPDKSASILPRSHLQHRGFTQRGGYDCQQGSN